MRRLKSYNSFINESDLVKVIRSYDKNGRIKLTKVSDQVDFEFIKFKLKQLNIKKFSIGKDGVVDVDGNVLIYNNKELSKLPVKFGKINGDFNCSYNALYTLENCPHTVVGSFNCSGNKLKSLNHCPSDVGINFDCSFNKISNLLNSPVEIGGSFKCVDNKLTSLQNCPIEIGGYLECSHNKLTKLDTVSNIKGDIYCWSNKIDQNDDGFIGWCGGVIYYFESDGPDELDEFI